MLCFIVLALKCATLTERAQAMTEKQILRQDVCTCVDISGTEHTLFSHGLQNSNPTLAAQTHEC